jgi:NAD(P) transhydrogenase
MMLGDATGMLKLLFDRQTHTLLGVHALGQRATEIVHIGQAVLFYGGSVEYFRDMVFNYPTLAEAYKVAALDGLNKLWEIGVSGAGETEVLHGHVTWERA